MTSESRTLIVLLLLFGLFASCCLCVPVVALIAVPAVARVQTAAEEVRAKQEAERQALAREMQQARIPLPPRPPMVPPPTIPPPTFPRTRPKVPFAEPTVEPFPPPIAVLEPPIIVDSPRPAPKQRPPVKKTPATGLASLSEGQRRAVYRSVTVLSKMEDSMKRQIEEQKKRGFSTAPLERMLKDRQSRQSTEMERVLKAFQLSREELDQVLTEGKAKGW